MTEPLYRRRAGEPVEVYDPRSGKPVPDWLAKHVGRLSDDDVVARGEGFIGRWAFENHYEPVPAPDAREALDLPRVWALLRIVWQSFDHGGESMRSQRAQALEVAMRLIDRGHDIDKLLEAANTCDADRWSYISASRLDPAEVAALARMEGGR